MANTTTSTSTSTTRTPERQAKIDAMIDAAMAQGAELDERMAGNSVDDSDA